MRDLIFLPERVQSSAIRVSAGQEVMWPFDRAEAAVDALAAANRVILGLDLRSDGPEVQIERSTQLATEVPWSSFEPIDPATAAEDGRRAAIEALRRPLVAELVADGYSWVLITWDDHQVSSRDSHAIWVDATCTIAESWRTSGLSIREHFQRAAPDLGDEADFVAVVSRHLRSQPELTQAWQGYVDDKRGTPSPYLDLLSTEVGWMNTEGQREDVSRYDDSV